MYEIPADFTERVQAYEYERHQSVTEAQRQAELRRVEAAESRARMDEECKYYGRPDEELPQDWLDHRPHAMPWLRKWID